MGGVFSTSSRSNKSDKAKGPPAKGGTISPTDRAILDLKNSRDRLSRYKKKLDADEDKLLERAKVFQKEGNKSMALGLMKLRKHKILEASNVEGQLLKILQMVDTIVGKENEMEIVKSMKEGKNALEQLHKEMSVDDVLQLVEDINDQTEVEREINDILSQGAGLSSADESAVEEELAALEKQMEEEGKDTSATLPVAPSNPLPVVEAPEKTVTPPKKELVAS